MRGLRLALAFGLLLACSAGLLAQTSAVTPKATIEQMNESIKRIRALDQKDALVVASACADEIRSLQNLYDPAFDVDLELDARVRQAMKVSDRPGAEIGYVTHEQILKSRPVNLPLVVALRVISAGSAAIAKAAEGSPFSTDELVSRVHLPLPLERALLFELSCRAAERTWKARDPVFEETLKPCFARIDAMSNPREALAFRVRLFRRLSRLPDRGGSYRDAAPGKILPEVFRARMLRQLLSDPGVQEVGVVWHRAAAFAGDMAQCAADSKDILVDGEPRFSGAFRDAWAVVAAKISADSGAYCRSLRYPQLEKLAAELAKDMRLADETEAKRLLASLDAHAADAAGSSGAFLQRERDRQKAGEPTYQAAWVPAMAEP